MSNFKLLFSEGKIKNLTIKNRIVSTAHSTHFAQKGLVSDRHINYYEERAKGGIGLIVLEAQSIHPSAMVVSMLRNWNNEVIEPFKKLTDAVHKYGTKIFAQLWHNGRQSKSSVYPIVAPSPIPCSVTREMPKELEFEEIQEIVKAFVDATDRCIVSGFDGLEVHCGHGYLLQQFLSPATNKRQDEYGGSLENRMRIVTEILIGIRNKLGSEIVVGVRISGDEFIEGGLNADDVKEIVKKLDETGLIDYVSVTAGCYETIFTWLQPMYYPLGSLTYLSAGIKEITSLPVICIGRINDPYLADKILQDGEADFVGMTRASIADPEFPNKALAGKSDEIRPCIACNQGCWQRAMEDRPITCTGNAAVGREKALSSVPAKKKKKIVIIGGGPAGLETARVAALRGHGVSLFEKEDTLGGQLRIASKAPGRENFYDLIRYLEKQMKVLDVELFLSTEMSADKVLDLKPQTVVVATGAVQFFPEIQGTEGRNLSIVDSLLGQARCPVPTESNQSSTIDHLQNTEHRTQSTDAVGSQQVETPNLGVCTIENHQIIKLPNPHFALRTSHFALQYSPLLDNPTLVGAWDVLEEKVQVGNNILLIDGEGHMQSCSTADFLAEKGKNVEIVTPLPMIGYDVEMNTSMIIFQRLLEKKVKFTPFTTLKEIRDNKVILMNVYTKEEIERTGIDNIVISYKGKTNNKLYYELKGKVEELYAIGDCLAPRDALKAIAMGYRLGIKI